MVTKLDNKKEGQAEWVAGQECKEPLWGRADPGWGKSTLSSSQKTAFRASKSVDGSSRLYSLFSSSIKSLPTQVWGDSGKRKIEWLSALHSSFVRA